MGRAVRPAGRTWSRILPAAVLAVSCLGSAGCVARALRPENRRVDVGGLRLHVVARGRGAPAVVLDAGLGGTADSWSEVAPAVASFTRVVAYDRAGLGRSDAGPSPRTSGRIVEELKILLERSGVPPPYVLVGHSFGGLNVRLFAARWPEAVAGLVLVDATHEDFPSREVLLRGTIDRRRAESQLLLMRSAIREEYESFEASAEEMRRAGPLPRVPIIVLSAGRFEGTPALRRLWLDFQDDLVGRYVGTEQRIAETSGHNIPANEPETVVAAIRDVVAAVRRERDGVNAGPAPGTARPAPGRP